MTTMAMSTPATPFSDEASFKAWVKSGNKDEKKAVRIQDFETPGEAEKALMDQVRTMINPKHKDTVTDLQISRFCRGYAMCTFWTQEDKAERTAIMLNLALDYIVTNKIAELPDKEMPKQAEWHKAWPQCLPGITANGAKSQIIWYTICPTDFSKQFTAEETVQYHLRDMQMVQNKKRATMERKGQQFTGQMHVCISDMNSDRGAVSKSFIKYFSGAITTKEGPMTTQHYFPDSMACTFVINAPMWVRALWSFGKMFMEPTTAVKFQIFGSSYHEALKQAGIGKDQLPMCCNGTAPNPPGHHADLGSLGNGTTIKITLKVPPGISKVKFTFTIDTNRSASYLVKKKGNESESETVSSGKMESTITTAEVAAAPGDELDFVFTNTENKSTHLTYNIEVE